MQLIVILGALVAVNVGLVYVGSETYEGDSGAQPEGIVEVEELTTQDASTSEPAQAPVTATEETAQ